MYYTYAHSAGMSTAGVRVDCIQAVPIVFADAVATGLVIGLHAQM